MSKGFMTELEMAAEYGRKLGVYDPEDKSIEVLAADWLAELRAVQRANQERRRLQRDNPGEAAKFLSQVEMMTVKMAVIEQAIEQAGGWIDKFCDVGSMGIYGPDRRELQRF